MNNEDDIIEDDNNEESDEDSDFERYLKEMESLKTDFSDLKDLDLEEIQEMQEAIAQVKEKSESNNQESSTLEAKIESSETGYQRDLSSDFSDLNKIDLNELIDMKEAIESVKQEELAELGKKDEKIPPKQTTTSPLEKKIQAELQKRKEEVEEEKWTPEKFLTYLQDKRNKIYYHALYFLIFNVNDHVASKELLYDVLKEKVSKSAIDPIQEHQFYFGLGYLLKLQINGVPVVRYMLGGKFKINADAALLEEILSKVGEPISTRPVIAEDEKKKMFRDFLEDDFSELLD